MENVNSIRENRENEVNNYLPGGPQNTESTNLITQLFNCLIEPIRRLFALLSGISLFQSNNNMREKGVVRVNSQQPAPPSQLKISDLKSDQRIKLLNFLGSKFGTNGKLPTLDAKISADNYNDKLLQIEKLEKPINLVKNNNESQTIYVRLKKIGPDKSNKLSFEGYRYLEFNLTKDSISVSGGDRDLNLKDNGKISFTKLEQIFEGTYSSVTENKRTVRLIVA